MPSLPYLESPAIFYEAVARSDTPGRFNNCEKISRKDKDRIISNLRLLNNEVKNEITFRGSCKSAHKHNPVSLTLPYPWLSSKALFMRLYFKNLPIEEHTMRTLAFVIMALLFCATTTLAAVVGAPASLTVPAADSDGGYSINWGTSSTAGSRYILQEATTPAYSDAKIIYSGTDRSIALTGRVSGKTYYYRLKAQKTGYTDSSWRMGGNGCAVPGDDQAIKQPSITIPANDGNGTYMVKWGASKTDAANYLLEEAIEPTFTSGLRVAYVGAGLSKEITGRALNKTYYYRVRAIKPGMKDSVWLTGGNGCAIPGATGVAAPSTLTVPAKDADGDYAVNWGTSKTTGVTYVLEEATNPNFTQGLRVAYSGPNLTLHITSRAQDKTYYYRVKAIRAGLKDSAWKTAARGCAVPGQTLVAAPADLIVPNNDFDGTYTIEWTASATPDAAYFLEEATNNTFTQGLRSAYFGTTNSADISGRAVGKTYYYRVKAVKPGLVDSAKISTANGCQVTPPQLLKMSLWGTEGQSMGSTTYEYDAQGRIIQENMFGATGILTGYNSTEYNAEGLVSKKSVFNGTLGKVISYSTYQYNAAGKLTLLSNFTTYGPTPIPTTYIVNEYDQAGELMLKSSTYNAISNLIISYITYAYNASGKVTEQHNYNFSGISTGYQTTEYDAAGNKIKVSNYDLDGNLKDYDTYEYDSSNRNIKSTSFNGFTDLMVKYTIYAYEGKRKLPSLISEYDFAGNLKSYTETEYNTANLPTLINVYDDTGLLKLSTVLEYND